MSNTNIAGYRASPSALSPETPEKLAPADSKSSPIQKGRQSESLERGSSADREKLAHLRAKVMKDFTLNSPTNKDRLLKLEARLGDSKDFAAGYREFKQTIEQEAPQRRESRIFLQDAANEIFNSFVPESGVPDPARARLGMNQAQLGSNPNYFLDLLHLMQTQGDLKRGDLQKIKTLYQESLIKTCENLNINLGTLGPRSKEQLKRASVGALSQALDNFIEAHGSKLLKEKVAIWQRVNIQQIQDLCDQVPQVQSGGQLVTVDEVRALRKMMAPSSTATDRKSGGTQQALSGAEVRKLHEYYRMAENSLRRQIALGASMPALLQDFKAQWHTALSHAKAQAMGDAAPAGPPPSATLQRLIEAMVKGVVPQDPLLGDGKNLENFANDDLRARSASEPFTSGQRLELVDRFIQKLLHSPSDLRGQAQAEVDSRISKDIKAAARGLLAQARAMPPQASRAGAQDSSAQTSAQILAKVLQDHPGLSDGIVMDNLDRLLGTPWKDLLETLNTEKETVDPASGFVRREIRTPGWYMTQLTPGQREALLLDFAKALSDKAPDMIKRALETKASGRGE